MLDELDMRRNPHRPAHGGREFEHQILHTDAQKRCQADGQHREHSEYADGVFEHRCAGKQGFRGIRDDPADDRHRTRRSFGRLDGQLVGIPADHAGHGHVDREGRQEDLQALGHHPSDKLPQLAERVAA